ncbi:hypothetical protein FS935_17055 [Metabacillus litoralis]|uniref:Uncharacterized protein n=1 Tax=Metabacillus litoralis TaxID=152268 RepID=A0A5C6VZX6_9BACI|nr:hypothetical protein [Metabacillus litoralis]TXC89586.1 hypothetical protein FS935_17055 [Metabacillus litoralis]
MNIDKMIPLQEAIEKSNWGQVNIDKRKWLEENYKYMWVDRERGFEEYVYQNIFRPAIRIYVTTEGKIIGGTLDTSDYEKEIDTHDDIEDLFEEFEDDITFEDDFEEGDDFFPPKTQDEILDKLSWALWVINKQAKAYRDESKFTPYRQDVQFLKINEHNYYFLKHRILRRLYKSNQLEHLGYHVGKDGKKYPYVKFRENFFHIRAEGKYLEKLLDIKRKRLEQDFSTKVGAIDFSRRNIDQIELLQAEEICCEFVEKGLFWDKWLDSKKFTKKLISNENGVIHL